MVAESDGRDRQAERGSPDARFPLPVRRLARRYFGAGEGEAVACGVGVAAGAGAEGAAAAGVGEAAAAAGVGAGVGDGCGGWAAGLIQHIWT